MWKGLDAKNDTLQVNSLWFDERGGSGVFFTLEGSPNVHQCRVTDVDRVVDEIYYARLNRR
jgi:hypothetical protein